MTSFDHAFGTGSAAPNRLTSVHIGPAIPFFMKPMVNQIFESLHGLPDQGTDWHPVEDPVGRDARFWRIAQAMSALYAEESDANR